MADQRMEIALNNVKVLAKRVTGYFTAEAADDGQDEDQADNSETPGLNGTTAEPTGTTPATKTRASRNSQKAATVTKAAETAAKAAKEASDCNLVATLLTVHGTER